MNRHDVFAEAIIDARVMARLATDRHYRTAENAEDQAIREAEITQQEEDTYYAQRREEEIGE